MKETISCSRFKELAAWLILTAGLAIYPSLAAAGPASPQVYGKSIGNWGHAWWQWATNFSSADNPITQPTGPVDCVAGQSGAVWFLAGTFGGTVVRTCSVQQGKALFFPIINSLFWSGEDCTEVVVCREKAAAQGNNDATWTCTVDDTPCVYTNQVVRDQSDPLRYNIPANSFIATFIDPVTEQPYPPGPRDFAIADGYWVMLEPLSRGQHTIHFTSAAGEFALDVTYKLTVTPTP